MSDILFSSIELDGFNLEYEKKGCRLYIKKTSNSFDAFALSFSSCDAESLNDVWNCKNLEVQILFEANACCDGVRHLNFGGGDSRNYIFLPQLDCISDMLKKLNDVEREVCWGFYD